MKQTFKASVWQEYDLYVAQCLDVDLASQGETREEALENLHEALQLYFTPPVATQIPEITSIEVELHTA